MNNSDAIAPALANTGRIHSIDQFRGYTVLGMFLVNYLGFYPCHYNYHHNDFFLSYADTIMPSFMFAVGLSFRLTLVKRLAKFGYVKTYFSYFKRSLSLCLISVVMYGVGGNFDNYEKFYTDPDNGEVASTEWEQFQASQKTKDKDAADDAPVDEETAQAATKVPPHFGDQWGKLAKLIVKSYLWETLAVIGVAQFFILPLVNLPFWGRVFSLVVLGVGHVALTHWFNWQFFFGYTIDGSKYIDPAIGLNNWMGEIWGTGSNRSWDGGVFGIITWGFAMLAGTVCYDLMAGQTPKTSVNRLLKWGMIFMILGYGLSCISTLYDIPAKNTAENATTEANTEDDAPTAAVVQEANPAITNTRGKDKGKFPYVIAASPVIPDWKAAEGRSITSFLAEPPFVKRETNRLVNYWMMQKRIVSLPYILFTSGFAFAVLGLFVITTDIVGLKVGIFRTFGMNPLVAYILHKMVIFALVASLVPKNSAPWYYWSGLVIYMLIVYVIVRGLEKQKVYVRM